MFLLMGIGYVIAGSVLISEAIGGCANKCRKIARRASTTSIGIVNSVSHPNSMKTSKTDDNNSIESIFPTLRNNSSENVLRRRQSEQIPGRAVTRRGHQRHNSLIEPEHLHVNHSTSVSMPSVDGIDENNDSIGSAFRSIYAGNNVHEHKAEINRAPTPYYNIDESFGEKIVH